MNLINVNPSLTEVMWELTCSRVSSLVSCGWLSYSAMRVGVTTLQIMTGKVVPHVGFKQVILSKKTSDLPYLKSDTSRLFRYISHVCVSSILSFHDAFKEDICGDCRRRTLFVFLILQKHNILLVLLVYTIKRPFTVSLSHYTYLYDQKLRIILSSFRCDQE